MHWLLLQILMASFCVLFCYAQPSEARRWVKARFHQNAHHYGDPLTTPARGIMHGNPGPTHKVWHWNRRPTVTAFQQNCYLLGRDPVMEVTRQRQVITLAGNALKRELAEFTRSHGKGASLSAWVDPEGLVKFSQHPMTTKRYIQTAAREGIWTNHPIIVGYSKSTGEVKVMDGNNRLNAAYYLGLSQVAAYIRVFD